MARKSLLIVDGYINLALGLLLLLYPTGIATSMGLPGNDTSFYPTILGAVLFGIGLALLIEVRNGSDSSGGLGLLGAIAINLCGGMALLFWLLFGRLALPLRGQLILWIVCLAILAISLMEIFFHVKRDAQ